MSRYFAFAAMLCTMLHAVALPASAACSLRDLRKLISGNHFRTAPSPRIEALRAEKAELTARIERGRAAIRAAHAWRRGDMTTTQAGLNFAFTVGAGASTFGAALAAAGATQVGFFIPVGLLGGGGLIVSGAIKVPVARWLTAPLTFPYRRWKRGRDGTPEMVAALTERIRLLDDEERALLAVVPSIAPAILDAPSEVAATELTEHQHEEAR